MEYWLLLFKNFASFIEIICMQEKTLLNVIIQAK